MLEEGHRRKESESERMGEIIDGDRHKEGGEEDTVTWEGKCRDLGETRMSM